MSHQKNFALTVSNSFFSFNFIRFSPSQWNNRLLAKARLSASELLLHLFHSNCWEVYYTNIKLAQILNLLQNFTYCAPSVTCSLWCIRPQLLVPQQKIKNCSENWEIFITKIVAQLKQNCLFWFNLKYNTINELLGLKETWSFCDWKHQCFI